MRKTFFIIGLVSVMAVSSFTIGCEKAYKSSADSSEKVKLTVWTPQEDQVENGWLPTMCEKFKKENPNVEFEFGVCEEGMVKDMVTKDVEAAADVFLYINDNITSLLAARALSKIGGTTEIYVKETNSRSIADSVTVDGSVYGIPFSSNTWFMIYDRTVFNQEDVRSLDRMLKKGKVAFPLSNTWYIASFYFANGCKMFGDGTNPKLGFDFDGIKAMRVTNYLVNLASNPNFMNDEQGTGMSGLRKGTVKAMFTGSWDCKTAKQILGKKFAARQLPCVTIGGQQRQMRSFSGSKAIGINSQTKYPEMANSFARFLGSQESQLLHYKLRRVIPCNENLLSQATFKRDAAVLAQKNTIDNTSVMQPFVKEMGDYWQPMEAFAKGIVNKDITKEQAFAKTRELNIALNKNIKLVNNNR